MATGPVMVMVVVVAAGRGARFRDGSPAQAHKLAQPFGGSTVLGCTLAQVVRSGLARVVVTTPSLHALAAAVVGEHDVLVLPAGGSADAELPFGMGHSIAAGVSACAGAAGWLVLPGDMPLVRSASLCAVAAALREHGVVQAQYRGRRGHPVGFPAKLHAELAALGGDEGARSVLAGRTVHAVEVDDPGVLLDVDTPGDLEALRALHVEGEGAAEGG